MVDEKFSKYKKIVSIFLLFFSIVLVNLVVFALIAEKKYNNIAIINTPSGRTKFELIDNVTNQDKSVESLDRKLKISGDGNNGELSGLIKVTKNNILFDYIIDDKIYYFSAINKTIRNISLQEYISTQGIILVRTSTMLGTIRDRVNNDGQTYDGDTLRLNRSINLNDQLWTPIGISSSKYFAGTFDGNGYSIYNYTIKDQTYSGIFGYTINAKISNLQISNGKICGSGSVAGGVVATAENTEISNCQIDSSVEITDKFNTCGGVVGEGSGKIENCDSSIKMNIVLNGPKTCKAATLLEYYVTAGGIAGRAGFCDKNAGLSINKCFFKGSITVSGRASGVVVAGIASNTENASVSNCVVSPNFDVENCEICKAGEGNPISAAGSEWIPLDKKVANNICGGYFYRYHTRNYGSDYVMVYRLKLTSTGGDVTVEEWHYPGGLFGIGKEDKKVTKTIVIESQNNYIYLNGQFVEA